ncbi:MAG: ATPase, T2SS/T4P/T4SS family [Phycisphaerae bacterium]
MQFDSPLADMPAAGVYFNLFKLALVFVLFVGWTLAMQWADRDTDVVKTRRERWNLIMLAGGLTGLAVLFLVPWSGKTFFLGLSFWVLLGGGSVLTYVFHRNGRVVPDRRVLTVGHVKRLLARDRTVDTKTLDRGQRVHLADHEGSHVGRPQDRAEFERYTILQDFIFDLLWRRSSDAEILTGPEKVRVVYRIDGVASERNDALDPETAELLIPYIKILAGLNPEEIRRPQRGCLFAALLGDTEEMGRINVTTSGSRQSERLRIKVQQPASRQRLDELGLAPQRFEHLKKLIETPKGLVLLSGTRSSGITTTQYAVLRTHDAFMQNIHILQRTPLYELDNITQALYADSAEGISYARQLQSVLRREPDVVGIGECEDRETAQVALRAARTGRKIYMGIEAKSTFGALSRLMSYGEDSKLVAEALLGVLNQRLVRVLCSSCRQSFKPDEKLLKKANLPVDKIENFHRPPTEAVYDRKGREIVCQTCQGSGYVGRTAVFEVLVIDDNIRQLIGGGAPIKQIKGQARKNRTYYLQEEGLLKVIDGTTSLDEIIRGLRDDTK